MSESTRDESEADTGSSRAFVALAAVASVPAFQIGWDLGAFGTVDYRWSYSIWVLSTVSLITMIAFRDERGPVSPAWAAVLFVPSVMLTVDLAVSGDLRWLAVLVNVVSLFVLPFALYGFARMLAGNLFTLPFPVQRLLVLTVVGAAVVGAIGGNNHYRLVTCTDFERIGDYQPPDCQPADT